MKTLLKAVLSVLVLETAFAIHEYGHLAEFQKQNIPIKEFSLGVGPKLLQYQTSSFPINLRLIPLMAYVAPTKEGGELFLNQESNWNKFVVYFAGVRNNLLVGLSLVTILQVVGWRRGNISTRQLIRLLLLTPIKIIPRFLSFVIGCATWGKVNLAEKFLLSTGGVKPPSLIRKLIYWNLVLGLINLVPLPPLDGSKIAQAVLASTGGDTWIPSVPGFVFSILFMAFFISLNEQDYQLLDEKTSSL